MLHCGGVGWGKLIEKMDVSNSRYLANIAASQNSNLFTDIIKTKRANHEKMICPY